RTAREEAEADRRRYRRCDTEYLPLRHFPTGPRGDPHGGQGIGHIVISATNVSRRAFMIAGAAVGGGLAIGINPFGCVTEVSAAEIAPEVTAWVVIRFDDTIVLRIARTEMGQGSLTGLAQLVVEELECDWKKVATEQFTAGQNLARKRVWGEMSTGGSRGIRISQDYVRRGGAAARMMLLQAAADQ